MRARAAVCVIGVLVAGIVAGCGSDDGDGDGGGGAGDSISVSSWGGVWTEGEDREYGKPFTEDTGIDVEYKVSGESPTAPALLQAESGNVQLDLISTENAELLRSRGLLAEFPPDLVETLEETARPNSYKSDVLSVGTTANIIACNPDIMERCPTNPEEFFDIENFPGPRAIANDEIAMVFALQADGVPPDEVFPIDIERAIAKLEEIKSEVKVWPSSGDEEQQVLIDEEVGAAIGANGRAFVVQQENIPNLEISFEGGTMSQDSGLVVMDDAPNKEGAFEYIRWILEHPEAQAAWTESLTYPTPTKQLDELIPKEIANALPTAHEDELIIEDDQWLVENSAEMQKAWQNFLAG